MQLSFLNFKTLLASAGVFIAVSNHYYKCSTRDVEYKWYAQPVFHMQPSISIFETDDEITCPREGSSCEIRSGSDMNQNQRAALDNFYSAYQSNNLSEFYNGTDWQQVFPDIDGLHSEILANLRSGSYKTVVGSEGSIVVIPGNDNFVSENNILYAIKFE